MIDANHFGLTPDIISAANSILTGKTVAPESITESEKDKDKDKDKDKNCKDDDDKNCKDDDKDCKDDKKKKVPNLKKKVVHEQFGEGTIIPELYGNETLDIMFKEGIKNVPYSELTGLEFVESEDLSEWSLSKIFPWSSKKTDKERPAANAKERGIHNATHEYAKHLAAGNDDEARAHYKNIRLKHGQGHASEMHDKAIKMAKDMKVANKKKAFSDHYEHHKAKEAADWKDKPAHNATIKAHHAEVSRVHGKDVADDMSKYAEAKHKLSSVMSKHNLDESYDMVDEMIEEVILEAADDTKEKARHFGNVMRAHTNVKYGEDNIKGSKERLEMAHDHLTKKYGADCAKDALTCADASHKISKLGYEGSGDTNETRLERAKLVKKRDDILLKHGVNSSPFDRSY